MNRKVLTVVACFVLIAGIIFKAHYASADTWNKKTVLTTHQPLRVPGATLPPGKYVFKLADSGSNRNIVQVFNEDETRVLATIQALPNRRLQPAGDNQFTLGETPKGSPQALKAWFYPGDTFGQEFIYSKSETAQIAAQVKEDVPGISDTEVKEIPSTAAETASVQPVNEPSDSEKEPVRSPEPENAALQPSTDPAESAPAAAQQQPATEQPATVQESAPIQKSASLPKTGSPYPLLGLVGLLSLGAAYSFRILRNRSS
jgi:LPXTG-motif cell wall-anchored protein